MFRLIRKFSKDEKGNFAFITAGVTVPLLMMIAGGVELSEYNKVERAMLNSSQSAVMAAFQDPKANWNKRRDRAQLFFNANFPYGKRVEKMKTNMTRQKIGKREVLTFKSQTEIESLFGAFNPLTESTIKVEARAEYVRGSGQPPRLISGDGEASVGG